MAAADGFVITGQAGDFYDGEDWPELLRSILTAIVILGNDEDHYDDSPFDDCEWEDVGCDELGISVPQVQLSASLGYMLSRHLTLGVRWLHRHDRRNNDIARDGASARRQPLFFGDIHRLNPM